MWDLHAEHEDSIRAHMEGLRRTVVSVLTDLHTLSSQAKLSSEVAEAIDAPWREMEKFSLIGDAQATVPPLVGCRTGEDPQGAPGAPGPALRCATGLTALHAVDLMQQSVYW